MKKLAALLLCLCMLLSLASCSAGKGAEIPEGMQIASAAGSDYYLYVPTTWNVNTHYGVSGAYFNLNNLSNVSVEKYTQTAELLAEMGAEVANASEIERILWYRTNYCEPALRRVAQSFTDVTAESQIEQMTTLDGVNAMQYRIKANVNGAAIYWHQVIAERGGAFYVFTFSVNEDLFNMLWNDVARMLAEFKFSDKPYIPEEIAKNLDQKAKAPEGMKLASNKEVQYNFYVPLAWTVDQNERVFAAYCGQDMASVSVVPYMPDGDVANVQAFFAKTEKELGTIVDENGYELIEAESGVECDFGGRKALAYRYRLTINGRTYEYYQVIVAYKTMFYSLTFTAPNQTVYNEHFPEVQKIIDAFEFR